MPLYQQYLPKNRRNEIELLIAYARPFLEKENAGLNKHIAKNNIDWDHLIQLSIQNRLISLLYRNLKNVSLNGIPEKIIERLRNYYLVNVKRNILLTEELLKILTLLEKNDVIALPFKGPVLAESLYGDISFRQFVDLDILVSTKDIIKVRNLLLANGYQNRMGLDDRQFVKFARANAQGLFMSRNENVFIGLHWELADNYISKGLDFQKLNGKFETINIEGKTLRNLSASDLLFYLCLHGTKHRWENLEMICSTAELIRSRPDINWNRVMSLAENLRCERPIYLGLFLAQDIYGINFPDPIANKISEDAGIPEIASEVYKKLFSDNQNSYGLSRIFGDLLFHINVKERLSEKIWYCVYVIIEPKVADWLAFPLPARLSFLHYVLRPIRLGYKWVMRVPELFWGAWYRV